MGFEQLESIRKKCLLLTSIGLTSLFAGIMLIVVAQITMPTLFYILAALLIVFGVFLSSTGNHQFSTMQKDFKAKYLLPLMQKAYPGCSFISNEGIKYQTAKQSHIVPLRDRFTSEDLIKGQVDDVNFITCDIKVEEKHTSTDSRGNTHTYYSTVFLGRYFEFDFNKEFIGELIVAEAKRHTNHSDLNKVETESIEFNKTYKTYASDEHTAFYILTPQVMERLLLIENEYKGSCAFSFLKSKLYMTINNNIDTFDLKITKHIDESILLPFKRDIDTMRNIIEILKLNLNIFKKGEKE